jgi:hypothetical protein
MKKFRKFIWGGIAAVAIGGFAMFNASLNSQNGLSAIHKANLEALADEGGTGCHYINGYTSFSTAGGGAYDCCRIWKDNAPAENAIMCQ